LPDAIDTPEKIWDLTHNINVKGVWFGSKHGVLSLRRHKKTKGSIINTASMVALVGAATPQLAYTASKGAVLALTRELAIVHAREGYRYVLWEIHLFCVLCGTNPLYNSFNSLCPAPLNTPLLQDWLGDDKEKRHRREIHFPTGRFGEAIEQAHAVVFLASDESSFVIGTDFTGECLQLAFTKRKCKTTRLTISRFTYSGRRSHKGLCYLRRSCPGRAKEHCLLMAVLAPDALQRYHV
jgi:NAD(P)-dependent dehydrogenase (short-subunit alcohol dehydrogenase family)